MYRWENLVEKHLREMKIRGMSEQYVKTTGWELDKFGVWLRKRKPKPGIGDITAEHVTKYIESRTAFSSKSTVFGVVSKLRNWGEFLVKEGYWLKNPLRWMRGPKIDHRSHLPKTISKTDMENIWNEAASLKNEYRRCLCVLMLALLYGTGMRRGELSNLKLEDWNSDKGILRVFGNKTGRERFLVPPEFTRKCLESYILLRQNMLLKRGVQDEKKLLVSSRGKTINGERVSLMLKPIALRAGIEKFHVHAFRHTCASDLLESGVGLAVVQKILGHASLGNTMLYTHVSDPEKTKAMTLHPVNKILQSCEKGKE